MIEAKKQFSLAKLLPFPFFAGLGESKSSADEDWMWRSFQCSASSFWNAATFCEVKNTVATDTAFFLLVQDHMSLT